MPSGIILASVGFMPSGHHLGLRRLYAVGAKVCSYRGRIASLFFSSAARRQKRRKGSGRIARSAPMTERGQVNFPSGSGRSPASVHRIVRPVFCAVGQAAYDVLSG